MIIYIKKETILAIIVIIIIGIIGWHFSIQPLKTKEFGKEKIKKEVVVYVAHDQDYSEPILQDFEKDTGIKVLSLFDIEISKTVGLVNRLIAEKNNPQADVFWNNEMIRSVQLKKEGIFEKYISANSIDIPIEFKDSEGYWTGFAARTRVIIYNTDLVSDKEAPDSFFDFAEPQWKGKACIANPLTGTTASHISALFALLGDEKAKNFLNDLKANDIQIVASNSMVRDEVVSRGCLIGITDTDDANDAIVKGKPIKMIFPDQKGIGTLIIPNTVGLINNAPHKNEGKKLIDYLLSKEIEKRLSETKAIQMPIRPNIETPPNVPELNKIKAMQITSEEIQEKLKVSTDFIKNIFIK